MPGFLIWVNVVIGAAVMSACDSGLIMHWCQKWPRLWMLRAALAAFFWPICLGLLIRAK